MSETDPRPMNQPTSADSVQLPAIPQPAPGTLGMPLPASPWIDGGEGSSGFNFTSFLHSLRRTWLSGLGIGFLIATTLAGLLWFMLPETYQAFRYIRVYRNPEAMLRDKYTRSVHPQEYEIDKQTQAVLLRQPLVLNRALQTPGIEQLSIVRNERWPWLGERENKIAWLRNELRVRYEEGSEILEVSMRERDDEELIKLLNAITDAYEDEVVKKEQIQAAARLKKLEVKRDQLKDDYRAALKKMGEFASTYGSTESENVKLQVDMGIKRLMSLENERAAAKKALNEITDLISQQQMLMQANTMFQPRDFEIEDMLMQYPEYAAMKTQLVELEQAMKLRAGQLPGRVGGGAGMQSQVSALRSQMEQFKYEKKNEALERLRLLTDRDDRQLQQEFQMLKARYQLAAQRLVALDEEYGKLADELKQMGTFSVDLEAVELELKQLEEMATAVNQEIETLQLDIQSRAQVDVLGQTAEIPDASNWIMRYLQVIATWLLALSATVLGLTFWDMQAKKVNNTQEIMDRGDVRVIGTLPLLHGRRAAGLMSLSETGRRMVEVGLTRSIDSIRTGLLFATTKRPYEVVMVTSALGQEGKTTVASQLAVSFARSGRRTLLIDGDLRNPQQHVVLGMPFQQGLSELLRGDVTLDDVVQPTPAEGLWWLSAGRRDASTDQALASSIVGKLFGELRQRFDTVIVDTGPVLTSPDAMLLGQHVDGAIISVRRDVSRLPKVTEACSRLQSVGIPIAGAVVNGADVDVRKSDLQLTDEEPVSRDPQLEKV